MTRTTGAAAIERNNVQKMHGAPVLTEDQFQRQVIDLARILGWRTAHFRPGLNRRGQWQTAVQGNGKGFPDTILVHPEKHRLVVAELKSDKGRLEPEQQEWLEVFYQAGAETFVWRPRDFDRIVEILR